MKVLDTTFLIDYLDNSDDATQYLTAHSTEEYIIPLPAYAEVVVGGEGNHPGTADIPDVTNALARGEIYDVTERHAVLGGEIAAEIGTEGPYLGGCDALIAAVGRELDVPVVSDDQDLTHAETKKVLDIEEYR